MVSRRLRIGMLIAVVCGASAASNGTVINVPSDQPTIQAAADIAADNDTMRRQLNR